MPVSPIGLAQSCVDDPSAPANAETGGNRLMRGRQTSFGINGKWPKYKRLFERHTNHSLPDRGHVARESLTIHKHQQASRTEMSLTMDFRSIFPPPHPAGRPFVLGCLALMAIGIFINLWLTLVGLVLELFCLVLLP